MSNPIDELPTAGPQRPARLRPVPGHDDLRRGLGLGLGQGRGAQDLRRLPRGGRQLHRHRQHLHQRLQRKHGRRVHRRAPRGNGHRHQVHQRRERIHRQTRHRRQRGRQPAQEHGPGRRGQPQASGHGLHRPLLAALLGRDDPGGGSHARVRRPRARGQGALRRRLRHARVGRVQVEHPGRTARLDAVRGSADRVQPAGTHRRARPHPHGQGPEHDRARVVAVAQRVCSPGNTCRRTRRTATRTAACTAR